MHVLQYAATQADSIEQAHANVKQYLETNLGEHESYNNWYDWFVVGGGRFSSSDDPYNNNYLADVAYQDSHQFQEYLDTAHKWRWEEVERLEKEARELNLTELLDNLQDFEHDHFGVANKLYPLKKLYDLAAGIWNYDSYFIDTINDSTNRKYMLQSIDKGAKDWYIVPVDFHF